MSTQDPPVCLLALGLGLPDSTAAPGFDVGTEDRTQVPTLAMLALYPLNHLPLPLLSVLLPLMEQLVGSSLLESV